jgi:transitional endoplasmic reticulum ATPase
MDGLENMEGVITIGATNRPEVIDPALLRPGRFDRMILVGEPDEDARKKILKIHTKSVPLKNVKLGILAKKMVGYSGADIEGVVREAAILALRKDPKAKEVTMKHFEEALELVVPSITEDTIKYYEEIGKRLRSRSRRDERRSEAELYM